MEPLNLSTVEYAYIGVVLAIGAVALWRTIVYLGHARNRRIKWLEVRKRFEAVPTKTPVENPKKLARERATESIERHFTVMRRVLVPLVIGITALMASLPILAESSASTASVIGAVVAVIMGLALRPFLENAVAGVVISASRHVRIGDTVRVDGYYGTVEDITATHSTIKVWDWRRYLVPNSKMLQSAFLNHSLFDTHEWANVEFWVSPEADIEHVKAMAISAASESGYMVGEEDPQFWINSLDKDSVCCVIAAWAKNPTDAWALRSAVRERIMTELQHSGIATSLQRHSLQDHQNPPARALAGNDGV